MFESMTIFFPLYLMCFTSDKNNCTMICWENVTQSAVRFEAIVSSGILCLCNGNIQRYNWHIYILLPTAIRENQSLIDVFPSTCTTSFVVLLLHLLSTLDTKLRLITAFFKRYNCVICSYLSPPSFHISIHLVLISVPCSVPPLLPVQTLMTLTPQSHLNLC